MILIMTASEARRIVELIHEALERLHRHHDTYVQIIRSEEPRYKAFVQILRSVGVEPSIKSKSYKVDLVEPSEVIDRIRPDQLAKSVQHTKALLGALNELISRLGDVVVVLEIDEDIKVKVLL